METQKTLLDAIRFFSIEQNCIDTVAAMRWTDGKPTCPHCNGQKHYWMAKQRRWKCAGCRKQFSVKVGTIFEDSALALDKWLVAMWMICNCKNGVSSYEIARDLKVTQKSAWFMLQRLRMVLQDGDKAPLEGEIEMDETFIGGKVKNMHKSKKGPASKSHGVIGKTIVVGMLERNGRVKAEVVVERTKEVLHALAAKHIAEGSTLITDEWHPYKGTDFQHEIINHATEYVRGCIHTQGIENFWALLKRSLGGTYISVEPFHLFRYIDEQAFRFNNRATKDNPLTDSDRFALALSQIAGKRLTYAQVSGKEGVRP